MMKIRGNNTSHSVSPTGDINGDDKDDILLGAYSNNEGVSLAGKAVLYIGCE